MANTIQARWGVIYRSVLLTCLSAGMAGCAATDIGRATSASSAQAVEALAVPPPGGPAIVGVVERRFANALEQTIALSVSSNVSGQNYMRVQFFGPMGTEAGQTSVSNLPLTEGVIAREMRTAFAGVQMQISPLFVQNSYGPFGYAIGRQGRDLCLYGWQRVAAPGTAAPFGARGTVQMRLRLCQAGTSEEALLSVMYGYTIVGGFRSGGWNPFGSPPGPDGRLGQTGSPIYPTAPARWETVLLPEPTATSPTRTRPAVAVAAPAAEAAPQPAVVTGPIVPPPPAVSPQPVPIVPLPPSAPGAAE